MASSYENTMLAHSPVMQSQQSAAIRHRASSIGATSALTFGGDGMTSSSSLNSNVMLMDTTSSDEHLPPICERDESNCLAPIVFGSSTSPFNGFPTNPMTIPGSEHNHHLNNLLLDTAAAVTLRQLAANEHNNTAFFTPASYGSANPMPNGLATSHNTSVDRAAGSPTEELVRCRAELDSHRAKLAAWEDGLRQARQACEAWKHEAETNKLRAAQMEAECRRARDERDVAVNQLNQIRSQMTQMYKQRMDGLQTLLAVSDCLIVRDFVQFTAANVVDWRRGRRRSDVRPMRPCGDRRGRVPQLYKTAAADDGQSDHDARQFVITHLLCRLTRANCHLSTTITTAASAP